MKTKIIITSFLIIATIVTISSHSLGNGQLPSDKFYDIWTYTKNMEDGKAYSSLAPFLEFLLEQRTLEKKERVEADVTPDESKKVSLFDPEGIVYLLDDLANIYAIGLVDFQKAFSYNKRALEVYDKIRSIGLKNIPVSDYYNQRRMLYYYLYPQAKKFGNSNSKMINGCRREEFFYGKTDIVTLFPKTFLDSIREKDLEDARKRMENRQNFLNERLGLLSEAKENDSVTDSYNDLTLIQEFLQGINFYNTYYRNFYILGKYWMIHKNGGKVDYNEVVALSKEALEFERDQRKKDDIDSCNLIRYWLGQSYLKLGDIKEGTYYIERFLNGIDEVDEMEEKMADERRKVMGKAVEEKERGWETFAVVLSVAGSMASFANMFSGMISAQSASWGSKGAYYSAQELSRDMQLGQQAAQRILQQTMITSQLISVGSQVVSRLSASQVDSETTDKTERLAGLITPLALKVGRYLNKFEQVELYSDIGKSYEELEKRGKAIRFYKEALAIIEAQRSTIASESQRISFSAMKDNLYKCIIPLLIKEGEFETSFEYLERSKSRAFLDILAGKANLALKTVEETNAFNAIMSSRNELSVLMDQTKLSYDQINDLFGKRGRAMEIVPAKEKYLEFETLTEVKTITTEEALEITKGDCSIIEYFITDKSLFIFLIDNGNLYIEAKEIDEKRLFDVVDSYRKSITNSEVAFKDTQGISQSLYNLLIEPVKENISGKRLCIVPYGWLHYIPFQAIKSENEKYLVEEYAITYSPSATVLKFSLEKGKNRKSDSILVMANACLGDAKYDLPFAEQEGKTIVDYFANSKLFLKKEATEGNFKKNAPLFDVIHIATHAYFDNENPLGSSILLSSDESEDGRLEVTELYGMDLRSSLVTLSACETGLAYVSKGDELIGLIRGVMYSGASTVLSSLWKVEDESTAKLMECFYKNLKTMPKDLALQKAQIEIMKTFPKPVSWSPFILVGDYN